MKKENYNEDYFMLSHGETGEEDELEKDDIIIKVAKMLEAYDNAPHIVNPAAVKRIETAYSIIAEVVTGEGVSADYELGEFYKCSGAIQISGKEISITNPKRFADAAMLTQNMEICPKVDKTVEIDFAVNDLTRRIDENSMEAEKRDMAEAARMGAYEAAAKNTPISPCTMSEFHRCFRLIDEAADHDGSMTVTTKINRITKDIMISVICPVFEIEAESGKIVPYSNMQEYTLQDNPYTLLDCAKNVKIKSHKTEQIQIDLLFDGIWAIGLGNEEILGFSV